MLFVSGSAAAQVLRPLRIGQENVPVRQRDLVGVATPWPASGDLVVYGVTPWDQPWLTEHNLAHALARTHRVLFVDPPQSLLSPLPHGGAGGGLSAAISLGRERLRRDGNVNVVRPLMLPPTNDERARRASAPWIRRQVAAALHGLNMAPRVVIAARGLREGYPRAPRPYVVALVKDWLQAGSHLTGLDAAALRQHELRHWRRADLVCATSTRLVQRLEQDGIPSVLLRHGFNVDLASRYASGRTPAELAQLPRPLLGCTGRINER